MWVPTLAVIGCLAASAAPSGSARSTADRDAVPAGRAAAQPAPDAAAHGAAGPQAAAPAPLAPGSVAGSTAAPARFRTLPPGAKLPGDARCAARVRPTEEDEPVNLAYNATLGSIRLPADFFDPASHDPRANTKIGRRVTGAYTGTTPEILQWVACKWGIDERYVRAQAFVESSRRQTMKGDWTTNPDLCAPGHGLGVDGRPGECPESWGILQVRYQFFSDAFPDAISSTAFNADTAYAVWRACYEGYEWWLRDAAAPGRKYRAGDHWGCIGRWFSGKWHDPLAEHYIDCVRRVVQGREPCPPPE
ncbi:MAG TPA: hypothetical protein VFR67_20615 [Pilimelia sp.]|nr:hypothetical protein [Pilimelia sp.]